MIWMILLMVVGAVLGWTNFNDRVTITQRISHAVMIGSLGLVFGSLVGMFAGSFFQKQWTLNEEARLVTLRTTDGLQGTFFLASGSIGDAQYYFFYKEVEGGGYKPDKILVADNVTIYEEDREDGMVKVYRYGIVNPPRWFIVAPNSTIQRVKYEFHIPRGAIKRNFIL